MRASTTAPRVLCNDPQLALTLRGLLPIGEVLCRPADCSQAPLCRWLKDAPLGIHGRLQSALVDTLETLERTRHAFRSRELGELRRRLEQLLEELPRSVE
ncbi:hypothetical protein [Pseudomonas sp. LRF_L74]|uniref:hypothetical protein n=1 Tax=Pseudomonas sp. LRF_L74 TaxID=3369422 RepID=UPI003F5DF609